MGVWVVVRASCVAYKLCGLLVKDKQASVPFMKSEIAFHWAQKAGDCHSCFFISGLDAMWQVREKPPKFDASLFISYKL